MDFFSPPAISVEPFLDLFTEGESTTVSGYFTIYVNKNTQMEKLNALGIDSSKAKLLTKKLNKFLSNYSIFYQNYRGYQWIIKGEKFFKLQLKFEELYNDLFLKIDVVAERVLTLISTPNHNYGNYRKTPKIKESAQNRGCLVAAGAILAAFQTIITLQRELLILSADAGDIGTTALMSDYIRF